MQHPLIPYFTTSRYRVDTMVELADPKSGEKGVDLGSGDGRIVIAFAQSGVEMHGFELDEKFVNKSIDTIKQEGLTNAFIHQKNFWGEDLSSYDIITIYPMPDIMEELEAKLKKEAKPNARIVTNYYPLPSWQSISEQNHIFLYRKEKDML